MPKLTEWNFDDEIKTKLDLVQFLVYAVADVNMKRATKKDMEWLAIACNDYLRIGKQKGWI